MDNLRMISSLIVAAMLFGCAAPQTYKISSDFDRNAAQAMLAKGPNAILGNALIRQQGGGVVTCAGNDVWLVPVTAYASERMRHLYGSDQKGYRGLGVWKFEPEYAEYQQLAKSETCDAQGDFEFNQVADGEFFVTTSVVWTVGYSNQGGNLMRRVNVSGGQIEKVVLTP